MSIWDNFPEITDSELRQLVEVTCEVILDFQITPYSSDIPGDVPYISTSEAAKETTNVLKEKDVLVDPVKIKEVLENTKESRDLSIMILDQIRKNPVLSSKISEKFDEKKRLMAVPVALLLAGGLLVLAIKIKKIKISNSDIDVDFYEISSESLKALLGFLGQ